MLRKPRLLAYLRHSAHEISPRARFSSSSRKRMARSSRPVVSLASCSRRRSPVRLDDLPFSRVIKRTSDPEMTTFCLVDDRWRVRWPCLDTKTETFFPYGEREYTTQLQQAETDAVLRHRNYPRLFIRAYTCIHVQEHLHVSTTCTYYVFSCLYQTYI